MSEMTGWLLVWPILLPVLASALAVVAWGRERTQTLIGFAGLLAQFVAALALFVQVWAQGPLAMSMGGWAAPFGIALAADTLGAGLTLIATLVALAIAVYAWADSTPEQRSGGLFPLVLALMTGVAGAFLTSDIFNLYVWFEVTLISSFGLIVLGGRREQIDGAVKYAVLNLLATTLLLIAIGLLYGLTGTLNMADLAAKVAQLPPGAALESIALLFLVSLGMKAALFPLYFWLPAAYHTPLPAVSALFAALLTKVGVYALIRVFTTVFPEGFALTREAMAWAAAATMLLGALGALAEVDLRRLVSYTVVSGVGVMVAGLAIGSEAALLAAIFYIVHSIIISAALFMAAGLVVRSAGSADIEQLSGLYKGVPWLAVAFLLAGLSLAGVPPLAGFWPKVYLVQAGLDAGAHMLVVAVLLSGFLLLLTVGRSFALVFWREAESAATPASPAPGASAALAGGGRHLRYALGALVLLTLLLGLYAAPVVEVALRAASELRAPGPYFDAVLGTAELRP